MSDIDNQASQVDEPAIVDNSATVDTSEASTQIDEAPEATQVTEETTEVKAEDKVEESLLLGKFKTPEELATAYQQLESKSTKDAMEKAELSRKLNESFTVREEASASDDLVEVDPIHSEVDKLKRVTAVQSFVLSHNDADPAGMQEILANDPFISNIQGHEAKLEYAYLKSQANNHGKAVEAATLAGQQKAQASVAAKQVAQVESASQTTEQIDENAELQKRMQSSSIHEREAARREYIKKNLVNL